MVLQYHNTAIVEWCKDGTIAIDTGGWDTKTTLRRINEYVPSIQVHTVKGQLMVNGKSWEGSWAKVSDFV